MNRYLRSTMAVLVLFALAVSGCDGSAGPGKPHGPHGGLAGSYELIGDVQGTQVSEDATVTLTLLPDGTLTVKAVRPGEEVTDTGRWSSDGQNITIDFTDMQLSGKGPFSYDGTTLRLPIRVLDDGVGESEWKRLGSSSTPTKRPATAPAEKADWSQWDMKTDGAAIGTKAYADAVAQGADPLAAVEEAAGKLRDMHGVRSTTISENGRNIRIEYDDGGVDHVITERLEAAEPPAAGASRLTGGTHRQFDDCPTLPGVPSNVGAPGREAVNPQGGFGVAAYLPNAQPVPLHSNDSPGTRRAMLVVPQYDVAHDLGGEQQTIRDATGNNAECLSRILTRSGYQVDTILGGGQAEKSTLADSGFAAVERMTTLLRANAYGVFYFLGHGAYTDDHADPDVELPMLWMGSTNWNDPDLGAWMRSLIKKVRAGGVSIYSPRMAREHVAQKLTERLKLKWDSKNPPLWVYVDTDSKPVVAVYPNYFAQLRAAGTDFSGSLLWLNGCNTGKTDRFLRESGAASFVGWQQPMAGQWIAQAAATVFDLLADKARTLRGALEIWRLHEAWKWRTAGVATVPENQDDANMLAIGGDGQPFNVMAISPQTHILIFHIRHSPASASSDIAKSVARVENCWTDVWEPGLGALAAPLCNALTFAGHQPVRDEIDDALFEVGAAESSPVAGSAVRWTLAD